MSIVWLQTSFLGDLVLHYSAFFATNKLFPNEKKILITNQIGFDFYKSLGLFDEILIFEKKKSLLIEASRLKEKIPRGSIILQSHRSFRSSLLAQLLGGEVITYHETDLSFLAKKRIGRVATFHEIERVLLLLTGLGISRDKLFAEFSNVRYPRQKPQEFVIGVSPGSAWGTKMWPKQNYISLLQRFPNLKFKLFGSPKESILVQDIKNALGTNLEIVRTNVDKLLEEYSKLSLVIANDSAPIHIAGLLNIPTVTFFGPTVPEMGFGPRADQSKIFETRIHCRPCHVHGPRTCPLGHFKCMKDISVSEVTTWIQHLTN